MNEFLQNGPEVGDAELVGVNTLPENMQEFISMVDDLLPEEFELFELEGDNSVYFSKTDSEDICLAEIRPTTPREAGYVEGGPTIFLRISSEGDTPDEVTTWYDLEKAVTRGVNKINSILKI